jgi:hypothetical protein
MVNPEKTDNGHFCNYWRPNLQAADTGIGKSILLKFE